MPLIINGLNIHTEKAIMPTSGIIVEQDKIASIFSLEFAEKQNAIEFPHTWHLIPGMIDLHMHGAMGVDVMDATPDALTIISKTLAKEGVTAFLGATMTAKTQAIEKALNNANEYIASQTQNIIGAEMLGIHLEGPFISSQKIGAQNPKFVHTPDLKLIKHWQKLSNNLIKIVTLAPEEREALKLIKYLVKEKIIAAIGHSNATYEQAQAAIKAGCDYVTHIFNAMRPLHHRDPGAVAALLVDDNVSVEIIADGIHLAPGTIELILKTKGFEKIILVTDAMRAKGMKNGKYDLGGQEVTVKGPEARLKDGSLAGSVLTMDCAIRNFMQFTRCDLSSIIKLTAVNPAKKLGIFDRKGSVAVGKDADFVVLDDKFQVRMTVCRGQIVYQV
ncbi:MAG: N-acetylglucosamine-6-phosphate deacetylase [Gammaproteobacteria bacterium]|jgi:N-acetylglucosamine-6-phosphate deacetylase